MNNIRPLEARRRSKTLKAAQQKGVTLIEVIVFILIVNIAFIAVMQIFGQAVVNSVDPVVRVRATEIAQATLDEVMARRFDENTPTGGVPACGTAEGDVCLGITPDTDFDDVGDFNGFTDNSAQGYNIAVTVTEAGGDLGLAATMARKITVTVSMSDGNSLALAAYKVNF